MDRFHHAIDVLVVVDLQLGEPMTDIDGADAVALDDRVTVLLQEPLGCL